MKTKIEIELSPWVVEELKLRAKVCQLPVRSCAEQIIEAQLADDRDERRRVADIFGHINHHGTTWCSETGKARVIHKGRFLLCCAGFCLEYCMGHVQI